MEKASQYLAPSGRTLRLRRLAIHRGADRLPLAVDVTEHNYKRVLSRHVER